MKKLLLILLCLPMIGFGQVNIPDANFKSYLVGNSAINTNGDSEIQVSEANIFNGTIDCNDMNISDLTGIEAFTALTNLKCDSNQLTSLDVSANTALIYLRCKSNQLTSLDVSTNTALTQLSCGENQLTSLDVSNGNNLNFVQFNVTNNPNLTCIYVDNPIWSTTNWTNIDAQHFFSTEILPNFTITDVTCNGLSDGTATVSPTGGGGFYTVVWFDGLSGNTYTPLGAGNWTVTITDNLGCITNPATLTAVVSMPNVINLSSSFVDASCFGYCDGSAFSMPSGGTPPYSFFWNPSGDVSDNISGLCAGAYVVNITDANNCVNIETVVISEPLPLVSNNTINGCDSVLIGSNYYTISGAYTDTLTSVNGCDSTAIIYLTINNSTSSTDTQFACDSYTWIDGVTYTASNNTATFTTTNAAGCTEINSLYLTIIYSNSSYDTLSVNASIVWNGIPLNVSGDYSVTLINSVGCDSIVNLNLTVTTTGISDIANNKSNLIKITNILGQETPYKRNTQLFYIYDDGTVEKRIVIE